MELVNGMERQLEEYKQQAQFNQQAENLIRQLQANGLVRLNDNGDPVGVQSYEEHQHIIEEMRQGEEAER